MRQAPAARGAVGPLFYARPGGCRAKQDAAKLWRRRGRAKITSRKAAASSGYRAGVPDTTLPSPETSPETPPQPPPESPGGGVGWRRPLGAVLAVALLVGAVVFAARGIDAGALAAQVASGGAAGPAIGSVTACFGPRPPVPPGRMVRLIAASQLLNYLPAVRAGLVARAAFLKRHHGMRLRDSGYVLFITLGLTAVTPRWAWAGTAVGLLTLTLAVGTLTRRLPGVGGRGWWWVPLRTLDLAAVTARTALAFAAVGQPITVGQATLLGSSAALVRLTGLTPNGLGLSEWVVAALATALAPVDTALATAAALLDRAIEVIFSSGPVCRAFGQGQKDREARGHRLVGVVDFKHDAEGLAGGVDHRVDVDQLSRDRRPVAFLQTQAVLLAGPQQAIRRRWQVKLRFQRVERHQRQNGVLLGQRSARLGLNAQHSPRKRSEHGVTLQPLAFQFEVDACQRLLLFGLFQLSGLDLDLKGRAAHLPLAGGALVLRLADAVELNLCVFHHQLGVLTRSPSRMLRASSTAATGALRTTCLLGCTVPSTRSARATGVVRARPAAIRAAVKIGGAFFITAMIPLGPGDGPAKAGPTPLHGRDRPRKLKIEAKFAGPAACRGLTIMNKAPLLWGRTAAAFTFSEDCFHD